MSRRSTPGGASYNIPMEAAYPKDINPRREQPTHK